MRIVLVGERLRFRSFNGANKALPVLASSLHLAGFTDVAQLDLERHDITIVDVCKEAADADLVVFAGCLTPQWPEMDVDIALVYQALARAQRPHVPIIVGGYATKSAEDILRASPWITALFDGEGEVAMPQIARAVASGQFGPDEMREIAGLCFLERDGRYHKSIAPRVRNLDPYDQNWGFAHEPSVHDMDIFLAPDGRPLKTAQLYTQRGCPWKCGFCNKSMENNRIARLGEEAFREQLDHLKRQGFEAVYLDVDTFTADPEAARREASILGESGLAWGSNTRIDRIDEAMMRHCVDNGCVYMFYGVEHIDPGVCSAINKFNGRLESQLSQISMYRRRVTQVFREMRSAGLPSSYFIILGLPNAQFSENRDQITGFRPTTFEEDLDAILFGLERCDIDFLNLNVLRFMPGSAAADLPHHPTYNCVRPSGNKPITSGYFLPRVADQMGYSVPRNHPVYRLCESVGMNQPTTSALDPDRVHRTVQSTMDAINTRIDRGERPVKMFIERELLDAGMVGRDEDGRYSLAPLHEWDGFRSDNDTLNIRPDAEQAIEAAHAFVRSPSAASE